MWPTLFSNVHGDVLGNATARLGPAPGTRVPLLTFPQRRVVSILVPGVPGGGTFCGFGVRMRGRRSRKWLTLFCNVYDGLGVLASARHGPGPGGKGPPIHVSRRRVLFLPS